MNLAFNGYAFSDRTYQHAMLYIPEGTWGDAVYGSSWYLFNNIRELAVKSASLSPVQAYALIDVNSFGYAVSDGNGERVENVRAFYSIDDSDPRNFWQVVSKGEGTCLYNIGAKKYLAITNDGAMRLSDAPVVLKLRESTDGITIEGNTRQWGFVKNASIGVDHEIAGVGAVHVTANEGEQYFSLDGKRTSQPQRGLNIVRMSDGSARKVVVK